MLRPLFLEFPDAAPDHHPIDTDPEAASEFLLGADLLIAPPPYPEALDAYSVELPTPGWYNYWTGEMAPLPDSTAPAASGSTAVGERKAPFFIRVSPTLAQLPVFVRPGSILPIAPVVQSTSETPHGTLTLRVYVGDQCSGELYLDDGKTYAFQHGAYLRMKFSCEETPEGLRLSVSPHEGSYPAWWKEIHAEIHGWTPKQGKVFVNRKELSAHVDHDPQSVGFVVPDDGTGLSIELK
jgi:alpha-glucosidase